MHLSKLGYCLLTESTVSIDIKCHTHLIAVSARGDGDELDVSF